MTRKKLMDSASHAALVHREIKNNEVAKHKALSGLGDDFRKSANWLGPEVPPSDSEAMVLQMVRMPHDELNPTENVSFAFADRTHHKGDPNEISLEAVKELLGNILHHIRPMDVGFYKAGAVVLNSLAFPVGGEWAADMLCLKRPNDDIARALQAALLGTFISSVGSIDPEDIITAIGTFLHSIPAFAKLLDGEEWHLPYGDRTAYRLFRRG